MREEAVRGKQSRYQSSKGCLWLVRGNRNGLCESGSRQRGRKQLTKKGEAGIKTKERPFQTPGSLDQFPLFTSWMGIKEDKRYYSSEKNNTTLSMRKKKSDSILP